MAPWSTQSAPSQRQPNPRALRTCREFLDSGRWAIQDSNLGTSSLSGKPFVASSRPNLQLIPANRGNSAGGRRLEGTGRYKLVAPSWPHGRGSRATRRMTWERTSRRRCGQTRTRLRRARCAPAGSRRRPRPRCVVELVHPVTIRVDGGAGHCDQAGARHSPQRLPCRLDGIACLSPAGLRSNRGR